MFKKEEYKRRLAELNLTPEQLYGLKLILEETMTLASKKANKADELGKEKLSYFWAGKANGINCIERFLRGDFDCHDEFEE